MKPENKPVQLNFINIVIPALTALSVAACGQGSSTSADSVASDSVACSGTPETEWLPDTVFPSASVVKCTVEIIDKNIDGRPESIKDLYTATPGSFTFRNGSLRDANFGGTLKTTPTSFEIDWQFDTDEDYTPTKYGIWGGGTGWTGQPLLVNWPDSCLQRFADAGHPASATEVIIGSLSGRVYFIDLATGKPSREAINTGNPIKGTPSLDPTLNGNLYVGQGVTSGFDVSALVLDLSTMSVSHNFGPDPKAPRRWHAYDSSPVRVGQFLFRPGENGTLYKYMIGKGTLSLHSALRYTINGYAPGIEASMAIYRNYGYIADNAGNVICINISDLQPVWRYKLPDDTDATPVVTEEADGTYIYTGCEVEHEGITEAVFVKLNALTGDLVWSNRIPAQRKDIGEKHFDGGFYATALPGRGNCSGLIFSNCVQNTDGSNGSLFAFDRANGKTVYSTPLRYYAWSSPVGFTDPDGKFYIVTADCAGNIYLINGIDGKIIHRASVGANFESSPVVSGNSFVVGSRGKTIYKITLK